MVYHKFKAQRSEADGISFPSKLERDYYHHLLLLKRAKEVLFFLRQVAIHLPGNTKYVCDFQVFYQNGEVEFVDVKGMITPLFIHKQKQVESLYPFRLKVVRKGDF